DMLGLVQLTERLGSSLSKRLGRPGTPPTFVAELKQEFGIETAAPFGEALPGEGVIEPEAAIFGQAAFAPLAPGAAPPPPVIPAALRPLDLELDGFGEDEDEDSHIASLSLPLTGLSPAAPAADEEEDAIEDIGEAEENYSSLLAMKNPFRAPIEFVRVEEPESADGTVEPAVVFPGADGAAAPFAAPGAAPVAPPAQAAAAGPGPEKAPDKPETRPFDAPADASVERRRADPEETERALRSALATLQRMGGAA
ncbi:MAG: hypothetical protein H6R45_517, partial [Proteobacteria bacterium]|nr:hypothetical protein [Pseudomonadota bacterium]